MAEKILKEGPEEKFNPTSVRRKKLSSREKEERCSIH